MRVQLTIEPKLTRPDAPALAHLTHTLAGLLTPYLVAAQITVDRDRPPFSPRYRVTLSTARALNPPLFDRHGSHPLVTQVLLNTIVT